jgi:hypothetical protein
MAVRWEQDQAGQIVIEQNADGVARVFGALLLIPAFYFAYHLAWAGIEYSAALLRGEMAALHDLVVSIPGLLVTLMMLAAFAAPAWMLLFARTRAVLDPAQRTVATTRDFRLLQSTQRQSADSFDLVELALDEQSKSRGVLFHLTLLGPRRARLDLAAVDDRALAPTIELAQRIAEQFNFKRRERIAGWRPDDAPTMLYIWEAAFWRRLVRSYREDLANLVALLTGRKPFTWQMLNPWPSRAVPPVVLGRVQWAFVGTPFRTQNAFSKAVRTFQVEQGSSTDEWEPGLAAVQAPRLVVEYMAPDVSSWTMQQVHLTASNEQFFSNGELLFQLHNAIVEQVRDGDLVYLQGLELVAAQGPADAPLYRLRQTR